MPDGDNPYDKDDPLSTVWRAGYDARMAAHPRTECPYSTGEKPEPASAWLGGWIAANLERRLGPSDPSDKR